jgi:hypothetical protein
MQIANYYSWNIRAELPKKNIQTFVDLIHNIQIGLPPNFLLIVNCLLYII